MSGKENVESYLGVDLGTGSCKCIIIDKNATVLGVGGSEYVTRDSQGMWAEQDPEELINSMIRSIHNAYRNSRVNPKYCRSMSITGALHSLLLLDRRNNPLTGVITWVDERATSQASELSHRLDPQEIYNETGCPVHGLFPLYKIIWMRQNQPDLFKRAVRFVSGKEFVISKLVEEFIIDPAIAAGSGLLNTYTLDWSERLLQITELSRSNFSKILPPDTVISGINHSLADRMGLPRDVKLVLGSADAANSSIGAGAISQDIATIMIGTSGAIRIISNRTILDKKARSWCYAIDKSHWLVGGAINNGGLVLSWFRNILNQQARDFSFDRHLSYDDLIDFAGQSVSGARGVLCLPFFAGERSPNWNMQACGVFYGLKLQHGLSDIARSLLEGVAFRLRSIHEVLVEIGDQIIEIRASGGFTHSDLWLQIIANTLDKPLSIPGCAETSGLGTGIWALIGDRVINTIEDAKFLNPVTKKIQPDGEVKIIYDQMYTQYQQLYSKLYD